MKNIKEQIHGLWWIPDGHRRFSNEKLEGMLTIFDDNSHELEVHFYPHQKGLVAKAYEHYDVIWGEDIFCNKYTLFNCYNSNSREWTIFKYKPTHLLKGEHIQSLDVICYDTCIVKYKYFRNWVQNNRVFEKKSENGLKTLITIDNTPSDALLASKIDDNTEIFINWTTKHKRSFFEMKIEQDVYLKFKSEKQLSLCKYLDLTSEFTQFLSLALFKEQNASILELYNRNESKNKVQLIFKIKESSDPFVHALIPLNIFREKMPQIIRNWHEYYNQMSCISRYLIKSISESNTFDHPDFLIVAQALDGYFKRFVNKKNDKNIKKYHDQINLLIKKFEDVEAIKECKLNAKTITASRHLYSHLMNEDEENVKGAVDGSELYWLTQKCVILLTCCILDCIGFSIGEINTCCNNQPIKSIIDAMPLEYKI